MVLFLAGPQGLEPRPTVPKTVVLPLDDGPMCAAWIHAWRLVGANASKVYAQRGRSVKRK